MLNDNHERMAAELEASGDYRVLRRIVPRRCFNLDDGTPKKIGVILDVETTGLDPTKDEVIELGMIKFEYSPDGQVFRILGEFNGFSEPSIPIPPEIIKLTGITDAMVAGKKIDQAEVVGFVDEAAVVIAHNASFDRRFCEKKWPIFSMKAWACSVTEIDWHAEGFSGNRLGYLLNGCGLFHDGHRAVEDCRALIEILSRPLPMSGVSALKCLLDTARRATVRIWAENSAYESKDALKARGYRWSDGTDGRPRSWWIDVSEDALGAEVKFLTEEIFRGEVDIPTRRLTAFDRFSESVRYDPCYAVARAMRLTIKRIKARRRKARAVLVRHSKCLANRRHRPSQPKVLSTIQRLGRTMKPLAESDRLTISNSH